MTTNTRTLEQRLKFDNGLKIGRNLIELTHKDQRKRAVCDISTRGLVRVLVQPDEAAMYSTWYRIKGDERTSKGCGVIVWGARDPALREIFNGQPVATVAV